MNIFSLAILFASTIAQAHTTIVPNADLTPRSLNPGLKKAPCGNVQRSPTPSRHRAGSTIEIAWKETKEHPGRFEIYFSPANDTGFTLLKSIPDTQDDVDTLPHQYSERLVLPSVVCDACTIQLVQVMLDNPQRPSFYYSCADISLTP